MSTIFKQLSFKREEDYTGKIKRSKFEFFVPGVNSGVYSPATLHVSVLIREKRASIFRLKESVMYSDITLTQQEFDALFDEMVKIKKLPLLTKKK